ncbi:hypothetical protein L9Z17_00020 [Leptospira noguchii]|nr:hypothetical protein [Leptospira noguchii]
MKRVSDILPTLTPDKVAELYGKLGDPSAQRNEVVAAIMKLKKFPKTKHKTFLISISQWYLRWNRISILVSSFHL